MSPTTGHDSNGKLEGTLAKPSCCMLRCIQIPWGIRTPHKSLWFCRFAVGTQEGPAGAGVAHPRSIPSSTELEMQTLLPRPLHYLTSTQVLIVPNKDCHSQS